MASRNPNGTLPEPDHWISMDARSIQGGRRVGSRQGWFRKGKPKTSAKVNAQTFQTVNFLFALKQQLHKEAANASTDSHNQLPRAFALLIIPATMLKSSWKVCMNNLNGSTDQPFWKHGKGLTFLDACSKDPTAAHVANHDVILITRQTLTSSYEDGREPWVCKYEWETIIADEGHVYLRGQHNRRGGADLSNTLHHWGNLLHHTKSTFILTGTPFVTKVTFDAAQMVKALATNDVRRRWGNQFTDEGLDELFRGWQEITDPTMPPSDSQRARASEYAELLARCCLKRDEKSKIRGKHVMRDWLGQCQIIDTPLTPFPGETAARETYFRNNFVIGSFRPNTPNTLNIKRLLSYSFRYFEWRLCGESQPKRREFWANWTVNDMLAERKQHCRFDYVCGIIEKARSTKDGLVIFVSRVFELELWIRVIPFIIWSSYASTVN
jgi:hypothetical protein